jgi:hypothetical protein
MQPVKYQYNCMTVAIVPTRRFTKLVKNNNHNNDQCRVISADDHGDEALLCEYVLLVLVLLCVE